MPAKAKGKTTAKKAADGREPLDLATIRSLQKAFKEPVEFLKFLQRLPPNKTIVHPEVEKKDPTEPIASVHASMWVATSWYARDCLGFDRYADPDKALGTIVTHYYGKNFEKEQDIPVDAGWVFAVVGRFDQLDLRSIEAARLAIIVRECVEEYGLDR